MLLSFRRQQKMSSLHMLTGFIALGEWLVCVYALTLGWKQEDAVTTHTCQL